MLPSVCLASRNPWAEISSSEDNYKLGRVAPVVPHVYHLVMKASMGEVTEWGQTQGDVLRIMLKSEKNRWP